MKKKIYQVNIGGYDQIREHKIPKGVEYKLITEGKSGDSFLDSRTAKFNPPWPVEDGTLILYIDGAFQITEEGIDAWMEDQIQDYDMVFNVSFNVSDCYEEGARVLARGIGNPAIITKQLEAYRSEGVRSNNNQAFGGIFIFRDSVQTRTFLQEWEKEFLRYPSRDQIALHKLRQQTELNHGWMNPYTLVQFPENHGFKTHFVYHPYHTQEPRPKINFITGWDSYKLIGKRLNEQIERIPDDEWICAMDGDIMFLTDHWGKQLEQCILDYPDTAIFGCYTNRIGLDYQLEYDFSEDMDILSHKEVADELAQTKWAECKRIDKHIAGFLQLFPKWYWKESPYPEKLVTLNWREHKSAFFDWIFCQHAIDKGYPVRIMEGVYVFHGYRLNAPDIGSISRRQAAKVHTVHLM